MKCHHVGNVTVEIVKENLHHILVDKISSRVPEERDDAFFMVDLGDIAEKFNIWNRQLPRVEPFYAVKCNDDPVVLALLANLGTGFDCASKAEIQKVLDLQINPKRIIYANPCKQNSYIKYATSHGVNLMTFDNDQELHKIKRLCPDAQLVIRIQPPDGTKCQCELSNKFGCTLKQVPQLLQLAKELELDVIGVSFHVGSGCYDAKAFSAAVGSARATFDMAELHGYHFNLLDIGGGFPGQKSAKISFEDICVELNKAIDWYFPLESGVRIIAEPGRFFVASACTLATNVIAKRRVMQESTNDSEEEIAFMYYMNDGVYGSFNCILYDHSEVEPTLLPENQSEVVYKTSIWGPTCDGLDCIMPDCKLPELNVANWIIFKDMGAYTMCAGSTFNGMPRPKCFYTALESQWNAMELRSEEVEGNVLPTLAPLAADLIMPVYMDQVAIVVEG